MCVCAVCVWCVCVCVVCVVCVCVGAFTNYVTQQGGGGGSINRDEM